MQVSRIKTQSKSFSRTPVATGIMLALATPALLAQTSGQIEEITVTAQKRAENLQDVPISIQTLGTQQIRELNLQNFMDYTKMLPSVSVQPSIGAGSSFSLVYMRGISTAGDGQATTSQPSVSMYLDELPITTIQGNLDVHMYDIARVEALAGPQGTLYGASSQAGTIRVITNAPELGQFSSSIGIEANSVDADDTGYVGEGYVNAPIGDNAAIRLVGWVRQDAGWIDNVLGSRTFPGHADDTADDVTLTNTDRAKDNYNTIDTIGARAALRVDLNDNWTVKPTFMYQKSEQEGSWGDDLSDFAPGDYAVTHFKEEYTNDDWWMVGLTIEGKVGNFDVVYSGSYLDRHVDGSFDYADYSYWYDTAYTSGFYSDLHFSDTGAQQVPNIFESTFPGQIGTRVMTGARFRNDDNYTKENHELRISTDPEKRVRGLLGLFWQHQYHDFEQHWEVEGGVGTVMEMNSGQDDPRFEDTVYLNSMFRNDRDKAVFANVSFDIREDLELNLGMRYFEPEVTVEGFFGFGYGFYTAGWTSGSGEFQCDLFPEGQEDWFDKPCRNVRKGIKETGTIGRANLTWNVTDEHMIYGTWSEGYRPGGVQRNPAAGEYLSDFLTNWEFGWKTQWLDNRLQLNGAVFHQTWDDIQVSFTGDNAITAVNNGPTAEVNGLEAQILWLPTDSLRITSSMAFYDSKLKDIYGPEYDDNGVLISSLAPAGTKLPVTADFKGNLVARYFFEVGSFDAHLQGALAHEGKRGSDLDQAANAIRGDVPAYTTLDLSAGIAKEDWSLELFIKNATGEDAPLYLTGQCAAETCGAQTYGVRVRPRTFAIRYTKDF